MFELSPAEWTAIHLSLRIALVATIGALPFGIVIGYLLARKNFWGKSLVDSIVLLPLVLPPVVTGYLLLIWFGRKGPIGGFLDQYFGIVFSFRWTGAALACAVMGFPLMVRAIRLSIEAIDRRLEGAASTLGASRLWVFATVTLPLALPGIIAGMVLCFAKALGEFGATITFVSNIPGRDANHLGPDLHADAGTRRRRRGDAACGGLHHPVAVRARRLRTARAHGRRAHPRRSNMLAVDVEKRLGTFTLTAKFEAKQGVTALYGSSGAGKTTIANMIAGLVTPDRGRIALDNTILFDAAQRINVPPHQRHVGYVFQEGRLFPHLSVNSNLHYGRYMHGIARDDAETQRIVHLLEYRPPAQASPRRALRRRAPACRHRPRAADEAAPARARRTACLARPRAKARNPALPRSAA